MALVVIDVEPIKLYFALTIAQGIAVFLVILGTLFDSCFSVITVLGMLLAFLVIVINIQNRHFSKQET